MSKPWGEYREVVVAQLRQHPGVDLHGEDDERGKIVDAVAIDLNGGTVEGPWGRKARRSDGTHRNGDGLTYRRPDGRFEIVDILLGPDEPLADRAAYAAWQPKGDFAMGENGYWTKASPVDVAPPTEAAIRDYFFQLIGRSLGQPANDWAAVLSAEYPWRGQNLRIPGGRPPGARPSPDDPFWGIRQQWSGGPKARLFLPTAEPDALGYYARQIQYIEDLPGGRHGVDFLWSWRHTDGPAYAPVVGSASTGGGGGGEQGGGDDDVLEALRALRSEFHVELMTMQQRHDAEVARLDGDKAALLERLGRLEAKVGRLQVKGPTTGRRLVPFGPSHHHEVHLIVVDPDEAV